MAVFIGQNRTILLLGGSGQLGSYLQVDLKKAGFKVIVPSSKEVDVQDTIALERIVSASKPQIILNTTAFHVLPTAETEWEKAYAINSIAVREMAKIAQENSSTFITISTDYVFDGNKYSPYTETDLTHPLQIYGESKLAGEHLSLAENPSSIIVRTSGVYGAQGSKAKGGNFVLNMLKQSSKPSIEVAGNQVTNPTYASDLSQAILKLMVKVRHLGGIYHLASEGECSWSEFATEIFRLAHRKTKVIPVTRDFKQERPLRPVYSVLKNTRARKLGIRLPTWQSGLSKYISELKESNEVN